MIGYFIWQNHCICSVGNSSEFYIVAKRKFYVENMDNPCSHVVYARTNPTQPLNLAHGKSRAQSQAPSCSLKEVSGQVEGKLRPRNATNTFAWPPQKLQTTLPATWPRFWPGHRRRLQLAPGRIKSLPDILVRYIYP